MDEIKLLEEINKIRKDPKSFAYKLLKYKQYFSRNDLNLPVPIQELKLKKVLKLLKKQLMN